MAPGKCLYEILNTSKDAEEDEIKKAYRKQALIWHPDKNAHRLDEAQERFKEVQNAYEILSDKHERAWYDSHRDQILKSGDRHQAGGSGYETGGARRPEDEEDLFPFFSAGCFSGYGDGAKSFYGVYSTLFEKLARQEAEAFKNRDDIDEDSRRDCPSFPRFGTADFDAVGVGAFYAYWSTFSTFKSFSWADLYNPASAPNRQVRRKMEEENKKARKAERKEYNDTVRELVAFIRKRDKRVVKFQAEEAAKRAARQAEDDERRRLDKEARVAAAAQYKEADWITASEAVHQGHEEDDEFDEEVEAFLCVACDKTFKSEKQLQNHERSKKHLEQVAALRRVLEADEDLMAAAVTETGAAELAAGSGEVLRGLQQNLGGGMENSARRGKKAKKKARQRARFQEEEMESSEGDSSEGGPPRPSGEGEQANASQQHNTGRAEARSSGSLRQNAASETSEKEEGEEEEDDDEDAMMARLLKSKAKVSSGPLDDDDEDSAEEAERSGDDVGDAGASSVTADARPNGEGEEDEGNDDVNQDGDEDEDVNMARMVGRKKPSKTGPSGASGQHRGDDAGGSSEGAADKKQKAGKKGVSQSEPVGPSPEMTAMRGGVSKAKGGIPVSAAGGSSEEEEEGGGRKLSRKDKRKAKAAAPPKGGYTDEDGKTCKVCGERFTSRSGLFRHIEETGHASLKK